MNYCNGITLKGLKCQKKAKNGSYCKLHISQFQPEQEGKKELNFTDLPLEMMVEILGHLSAKNLIRFRRVSKRMKDIVSMVQLKMVDVSFTEIDDSALAFFSKATTVNLCRCLNVTADGLAQLKNVESIQLAGTNMTGFKEFPSTLKAADLRLSKITNDDLKAFSKVKKIMFDYCCVDSGLAHLKNVKSISLTSCGNITDAVLSNLKEVDTINLSECDMVTDEGLKHLKKATNISLKNCIRITDNGLYHLENVQTICLDGCRGVTDIGCEYLRNKGVQLSRKAAHFTINCARNILED
jgi:hypothetical protein